MFQEYNKNAVYQVYNMQHTFGACFIRLIDVLCKFLIDSIKHNFRFHPLQVGLHIIIIIVISIII